MEEFVKGLTEQSVKVRLGQGYGGHLVDQCQVQTRASLTQLLAPALVLVDSKAVMAHRGGECGPHTQLLSD